MMNEQAQNNFSDGSPQVEITSSSAISVSASKSSSSSCLDNWERIVECYVKQPIRIGLIYIAKYAAIYPTCTIISTIILSLLLVSIGYYTNFNIETSGDVLWAPINSKPIQHGDWIKESSGFQPPARDIHFLIYNNENDNTNVLTIETTNCLFDVIETIQSTKGYKETCMNAWGTQDCPIFSATGFFNHSREIFVSSLEESNNEQNDETLSLRRAMSKLEFPINDDPVVRDLIFGYPVVSTIQSDNTDLQQQQEILQSAQSYLGTVPLSSDIDISGEYEKAVTESLYELNDIWEDKEQGCHVEVNTMRSFDDELERAVTEDTPYMMSAFLVMGCFCALYLGKWNDRIRSQSIVGLGAVATIILSLLTGYGILFIIGVPFTSVVQIFPYCMVGIGLDDTFIITGSFARKDTTINVITRIEQVMDEVGISIFVSTLTTVVAFTLGCAASLPGIRWFCYYAAPTVFIDFIYQITFFIAILVYDDRRIQSNRYDCCICIKANNNTPKNGNSENEQTIRPEQAPTNSNTISLTTKVMSAYTDILLKPVTKCLVLIVFGVLLVIGTYGASQQRQEMDFRDLTPSDSFVRTYFNALYEYSPAQSSPFLRVDAYFRNVDFSLSNIQNQMYEYINDLVVQLPFVSNPPEFFWLEDFNNFIHSNNSSSESLTELSFNEQVDIFLTTPPYDDLYKNDITRDDNNVITASRCTILFDQTSLFDVKTQIDSIEKQRKVTQNQEINKGKDDWSFFLFSDVFFVWELYSVIIYELLLTVVLGLLSVFLISSIFIPHPIGALLLTPVVAAIYCELMAVLYIADIYINGVSAIGLIMSIGLVVDYNFHIVLTYYETKDDCTVASRDDRVRKVLTTMGTSILTGGISTFLGVLPLAFSASEIFRTFFVSFLAIPTLGVAHGIVFVPVVLSLIGPNFKPKLQIEVPVQTTTQKTTTAPYHNDDENANTRTVSIDVQDVETKITKQTVSEEFYEDRVEL